LLGLRLVAARIFSLFCIDGLLNRFVERILVKRHRRRRGPKPGVAANRWARRFQILTYHKISPESDEFFPALDPGLFELQLKFMKKSYQVFDLEELVERARVDEIPERAVAITFDDGYEDNYRHAFPLLTRHGLPATIFLATEAIGNNAILWHDRIFDAFRYATISQVFLKSCNCRLDLQTKETAAACMKDVLRQARQLSSASRYKLLDDLEHSLRPNIPANTHMRMLTWQQAREMQSTGIRFGSHTVSHPILSRLSPEEMRKEVAESKKQLEDQLGVSAKCFAYPNGQPADYNETTKALIRESGYCCAVTTTGGFNTAFQDPFELRRGQPWQTDIHVFRFQFFLERYALGPWWA
jgi:peptidoglycan/xylan/chitin deacetylase (PgdA/CDA1 family)